MATWDLRRLQQFLDKHAPHPFYLIGGEETYLIDQSIAAIRSKALVEGAVDFNFDQFYFPENLPAQVRDTVETLPVMCPRRLIVYKGIQSFKEKDWEVLLPILESPVESAVFVLVGEKLDQRKKYFKKALENGVVLDLKRPYDNQIPVWVDYIAFQNQVELDRDGVLLFQQLVGGNLQEINNEMRKLRDYLGDGGKATSKDILQAVSHTKIDSVFELTNAIGRKDRAAALVHLAALLEKGQSEIGAVVLIHRHMRILAGVRRGVRLGLSGPKLSARVGVPQFFLKQYQDQSRHWDDKDIAHTIEALHGTDKALKSSPVSAHIWLENFILQTCSL